MAHFNYNGKILEAGTLINGPDSRALRYGDGIFETLKLKNGAFIMPGEHMARLWKGMQLLQFDIPRLLTPEKLLEAAILLAKKNGHTNSRIRIAIYRGDGGLYDPINNQPNYSIQTWPLANEAGNLNTNGLQLCIYETAQKTCDAFSNLKHNNFLPYLMGALFAKASRCNDAVILNSHGRVCDSTIANIFMVKDDIVYTPPLAEGCVAGILRRFLLQALPAAGFDTREKEITVAELAGADELFLSNSIYNIRWVAGLADKTFVNSVTHKIDATLRKTNGSVYC